jgi:hypothetical protein
MARRGAGPLQVLLQICQAHFQQLDVGLVFHPHRLDRQSGLGLKCGILPGGRRAA